MNGKPIGGMTIVKDRLFAKNVAAQVRGKKMDPFIGRQPREQSLIRPQSRT